MSCQGCERDIKTTLREIGGSPVIHAQVCDDCAAFIFSDGREQLKEATQRLVDSMHGAGTGDGK